MTAISNRWAGTFDPIDEMLRGNWRGSEPSPAGISWQVWIILIAGGACYGVVLGSFAIGRWPRGLQMAYSGVKVPILLAVTFWLTMPSFFVVSTLLGLRSDLPAAFRAIVESQAVLTVVLASLAPLTAIWYLSVPDYPDAILFNAAMFTIATGASQISLWRSYRPLIGRKSQHRWMLRLWLIVYAFVGIQMGWVLRPFIGNPDLATTFVRSDAFTNAYVEVFHLILTKI
jgi:hypothetical protein